MDTRREKVRLRPLPRVRRRLRNRIPASQDFPPALSAFAKRAANAHRFFVYR